MRRAQVSLYLGIGVFLLSLFVLYAVLTVQVTDIRVPTSNSLSGAKLFVEECLEHAGNQALLASGREGGLDFSPQHKSANYDIALHLINNEFHVPTNPTIEFYLERKAEQLFRACLSEQESIITDGNLDVTVQEQSVVFQIASPIDITGEVTNTISTLVHSAGPVRVNRLFDMSYFIAQIAVDNPDELCLTCLHQLTEDHYVFVDIVQYDDLIVYNITDLFSRIDDEPFVLVVGHEV